MSNYKKYKMHVYKKTTPITWFYCAYCGKYQSRRTSKIKNPNLIFCDNTCRAKYKSRLSNSKIITDNEIRKYLELFNSQIKSIASRHAEQSHIPDIYDDFKKLAPYTIYKCLQNSKKEKIDVKYFSKSYKCHLMQYLINFEYVGGLKTVSFDYFENIDNNVLLSYNDNIDTKLDCQKAIGNIIYSNNGKYSKIKGLLFEHVLTGKSTSEIASKYNLDKRKVSYSISSMKKRMSSQHPDEYEYLMSLS